MQVKLMDSVVSALDFAKARDSEIAWIDAHIETQARDDEQTTGDVIVWHVTPQISHAPFDLLQNLFFEMLDCFNE